MSSRRPHFHPSPYNSQAPTSASLTSEGSTWLPLISCLANFPPELFEVAISQLTHHPEYNSTLILRSETLSDWDKDFPPLVPKFDELRPIKTVLRRLLPRRPGRDASLQQYCTLYSSSTNYQSLPSLMVFTPITGPNTRLPYYHPAVFHLAFRYLSSDPPVLRIEVLPFPDTPTDPDSRLYRTCLSLLDTLHRYGWGAMTNYKKRVMHDSLVPREAYQDLYLVMRERHKHLVDQWQEVTDPLKHVFEDIGIATFLILLWKDMYHPTVGDADINSDQPWRSWPRPPGGFLDLGCGNGLLTHILISEGYDGDGIDLRARTSWDHYPESSQAHLHVHAFDPTVAPHPTSSSVTEECPYMKSGMFIIGNHADELTPWVPVLSTKYSASGYLSIPCCAWTFDERYERSSTSMFPIQTLDFTDTLNLGGDGSNTSRYSMYRIWLASLSLHCGWEVECENLRIPSTRNWAIIGRKRRSKTLEQEAQSKRDVDTIIENVRERGIFKTRKPEGKADNH